MYEGPLFVSLEQFHAQVEGCVLVSVSVIDPMATALARAGRYDSRDRQ